MRRRARFGAPAVVLWTVVVLASAAAWGATPAEGEVGPATPTFGWTGGPYATAVPADPAACPPASADPAKAICDHLRLTVATSERFWERHDGSVEIAIGWGQPADDFDLYVYDASGALVASSATHGLRTPREAVVLEEPIGAFEIRIAPIAVRGAGYWGAAVLTFEPVEAEPEPEEPGPGGGGGDGGEDGDGGGGRDRDTGPDPPSFAFGSSSAGTRSFDSRALGLPGLGGSSAPAVPPVLRMGEPLEQTYVPQVPVITEPSSTSRPVRTPPVVFGAAAAALALTTLAVFDRLPRAERRRGASAPAPPTA